MKKLTYLLGLGAIASLFLFNSCADETFPAPAITFDAGTEIVLEAGDDEALITGTIVAEAKLSRVVLYAVTDLSETQLQTITDFNSGAITTTDDMNYSFRITITDLTEDIQFKIEATDKDDQVASKAINIVVTAGGNPINEFTAILLGAQNNAEPSCLDVNTGTRYSLAGNDAKNNATLVDLLYYHGSTNLATLAAPDDESVNGTGTNPFDFTNDWSPQNATRFGDTSIDFDEVVDDLEIAEIGGLSASKMNELGVGDVIAIQTVDGKKGLIKVTALETGSSGSITIHVKIQQ